MTLSPLRRWARCLLPHTTSGTLPALLLAAAVIGCLGALATTAFRELLTLLESLLFGHADDLVRTAASLVWWQRLLVPALGGIAAGLTLQAMSRWLEKRSTQGRASGDYMEALSLGDGTLGVRASLAKAASSALSVATGSSIGREGSMVQLAALVGTLPGRCWTLSTTTRRLMLACGAAAGITAAYNAPIAGTLFVAEIILGSLALDTLGPLLVAASVANLTTRYFLGADPAYHMPPVQWTLGWETGVYALLGAAAGLLAPAFLAMLDSGKWLVSRLPSPLWLRLGLGGLVVGAASLLSPDAWGNGYSTVNAILQGGWTPAALGMVLACKLVATGASTGSGAVGGVFTPTLFVGAVLGALAGSAVHRLWPDASPAPLYAAIGMGAFLAATTHAPLTAVLMIFEMTGNPGLILPLMLACVLGYVIARAIRPRSVYAASLPVVRRVEDVRRMAPPTVRLDQTAGELDLAFRESRWQHVYVVDGGGHFLGAISLHDFGPWLRDHATPTDPLPATLIRGDYPRIQSDMVLDDVLVEFSRHAGERLPVVGPEGELRGYLCKSDLLLILRGRPLG